MRLRKSWREKLEDDKDFPKVVKITGKMSQRWGKGTVAIPAPREVDALMKKVPRGKVATVNVLRAKIAKKHSASIGCPITTGIFALIAAHAAQEALDAGQSNVTHYWRTLKAEGEINPKYPGGVERATQFLVAEGHRIVQRGKRFFVADYERVLIRK